MKTLNAELVLLKANIDIAEEEANADSVGGMQRCLGRCQRRHLQFSDWEMKRWALPRTGTMLQDYKKERANAVTALEEAIAALDSQSAFMAALGDEAVSFQQWTMIMMRPNYGTLKSSADISFKSTANTRFGVVSTTEREDGRRRYHQQFLQICLESPGCGYFSTASGKNVSHVLGANDCRDGSKGQQGVA